MSCGPVLRPMALSYVLWPCPTFHGPVLCPIALSYVPWPCPMSHGLTLCPMASHVPMGSACCFMHRGGTCQWLTIHVQKCPAKVWTPATLSCNSLPKSCIWKVRTLLPSAKPMANGHGLGHACMHHAYACICMYMHAYACICICICICIWQRAINHWRTLFMNPRW